MARISNFTFAFLLLFLINLNLLAQEETDILKLNSTIAIDGAIDEVWNLFDAHPLLYMIDGETYPDSADCSGYFKACWKEDSLFVLLFAVDDIIGTSSPNAWENDGYEIYFDMDNSKDEEYQDDNYQFRFNVGSSDVTGREGLNSYDPPDVDFAIITYPENYRILEVVFPLVEFGKAQPIAETYVGFDCQILDNDGSGREVALAWNNNEHEAYFNPSKMGTIYLSNNTVNSLPVNTLSFNVYPNPVKSTLYIHSDIRLKEIKILSVDGRICMIKQIDDEQLYSIPLNDLTPGIYLVHIITVQHQKEIQKIIKTH